MALSRKLRAIFTKIGEGADGAIYVARDAKGTEYRVVRKHWTLPTSHWGYLARPADPGRRGHIESETLADLALRLGHDVEAR